METISVGEIQKNISLLTKIDEPFTVIDKRRDKTVAMVYPVKTESIIKKLAGKYKDRVKKEDNLAYAKEKAFLEAMSEKYDLSY